MILGILRHFSSIYRSLTNTISNNISLDLKYSKDYNKNSSKETTNTIKIKFKNYKDSKKMKEW